MFTFKGLLGTYLLDYKSVQEERIKKPFLEVFHPVVLPSFIRTNLLLHKI